VDDFAFISIGTGLGAGLVLRGELHRGRHGAAGELDYARVGHAQEFDPCAGALCELARTTAHGRRTALEEPYDPRLIFAAARAGEHPFERSSRAVPAPMVVLAMEDNVDYRLLRHWRAQRWPALYAAAAEADEDELEERVNDLVARLDARRAANRSNVVALLGDDDR